MSRRPIPKAEHGTSVTTLRFITADSRINRPRKAVPGHLDMWRVTSANT